METRRHRELRLKKLTERTIDERDLATVSGGRRVEVHNFADDRGGSRYCVTVELTS